MATREQIVNRLANRRIASYYLPNLSRLLVRQAAQGMTDQEWDAIIAAVRDADLSLVGETLRTRVLAHLKGLALADVEAALAPGDTLTITELESLL